MIDLGAWAEEKYAIPVAKADPNSGIGPHSEVNPDMYDEEDSES